MESLYYSVAGLLALIVHLIINYEMFSKTGKKDNYTEQSFHIYSLTVLFYYLTDIFWGIIDFFGKTKLLYIDTVTYYIAMSLSVVCCCRYIIFFLNLNKVLSKILRLFGVLFCLAEFTVLIINLFVPVFFYFDTEGNYQTGTYRHMALIIQIIMYAVITLISFVIALKKSHNSTRRNTTICLFGFTMTVAITGQAFFPLLPLYSIGLMIGSCILHVFIQEDVKNEQFEVLKSMANVFYSMHVIDLVNDTADEFYAINEVKKIANHRTGATQMMKDVIITVTSKNHIEEALRFTDLSTVAERMKNKKNLSAEFIGNRVGWFHASFIAMETTEDGKPTKVIYTTRIIDEEKKQTEKLIRKTQTDEMTGLFNRRAYEEDIYANEDTPREKDFIYVSIDVNSLKIVNDTKGHSAGDELIIGVCQCMKQSLSSFGKLYRIGGDEFVAILFCNTTEIIKILADFDKKIESWKGNLIDSISVSYGWVSKEENPGATVRQLGAIAEQRMYQAKTNHYKKQGLDRRGQQDAHKALCELYTKILRINITDNTYQIVNIDENEQTSEKGFADKFSDWLVSFGKSGQVHPDDLEEYLKITNLQYLRNYFNSNKNSLSIFYRRKYNDSYKKSMMEIIPTSDYTAENQTLFLYVKNIDK